MSPYVQIKALETQLRGVLSAMDVPSLNPTERRIVTRLSRDITDAKLDVRDYEFSDTRAEQLGHSKQAIARLEKVRKGILAASEYNVFTAVDVAQLSAQIEQISEQIT